MSYFVVKRALTCSQTLDALCHNPSFEKMKEVADSLLPLVNKTCARQYDCTHQRFTIENNVFHGEQKFYWHRDSFPFEAKNGQEYQGWLKCSTGNDMMLVPLEENEDLYNFVNKEDANCTYRMHINILPNGHMLYGTFHSPVMGTTKPRWLKPYRKGKLRVVRLQLEVGDLLLFDNRMFHSHIPSVAVRWGREYEKRVGFTFRLYCKKQYGFVSRSDFEALLADVCGTMRWTTITGNALLKYVNSFSRVFDCNQLVERRIVTDIIEKENKEYVPLLGRNQNILQLGLGQLHWWLCSRSSLYYGLQLHIAALKGCYQFWKISGIYGHNIFADDYRE